MLVPTHKNFTFQHLFQVPIDHILGGRQKGGDLGIETSVEDQRFDELE